MENVLHNVIALEADLMKECNYWFGRDHEMSEGCAADRNDVIEARNLFRKCETEMLIGHLDHMDTCVRERTIMAFAADMGNDWVRNTLGWNV